MDDMESKLGAILGNPEMMSKIMALAQNFNTSDTPPKQEPPRQEQEAAPPPFPELDIGMLQKLSGLFTQSGVDKDQQLLLRALSPYLSHYRISKLERAMRAARMASMATRFLGTAGR